MKQAHGHSFEETFFPRTPRIIDLGGNSGQFPRSMFELYPDALIHSYEPTPGLLKSDRWNWFVEEKAVVSNNDKTRRFSILPNQPWANSLVYEPGGSYKTDVQCINIREVLQGPQIDLVKFDIEGAEYEILLSLTPEELQQCRQWTIEFHHFLDPSHKERSLFLIRKLKDAGFTLATIDEMMIDVLFTR